MEDLGYVCTDELARITSATYPEPLIFVGYVVTGPHVFLPRATKSSPLMAWFTASTRTTWITAYARTSISRGSVTDTELQVGTVCHPELLMLGQLQVKRRCSKPISTCVGGSEDPPKGTTCARFLFSLPRVRSCSILGSSRPTRPGPQAVWFPDAYYGNEDISNMRGHYYHVFASLTLMCFCNRLSQS